MVEQYDIYLINLDPTVGAEIKKTRPCVIISPNELNSHLKTVIVVPLTSKVHNFPFRVKTKLMNKNGELVVDQIRTIDKKRLIKRIGTLSSRSISQLKSTIYEMLIA
ncbi:MAG: type II toxin-antitoxin system PemK/MazF family toxin [Calditrichaeota bacterium]|nr:type II toxin-antitoxin system PemK/MazF family toxin [Calditrichota bacterium]